MNSADHVSGGSGSGRSVRLLSLDAFRAVVILSMIFVNYLPGMPGVPNWLLHAEPEFDGFTFTDVVFPGFLFIVGVAIPLAFGRRLLQGESRASILRHLLVRSAALIGLGVIMVNAGRYGGDDAILSEAAWYFAAYLCIVAIWTRPGHAAGWQHRAVKGFAWVLLLILLALFRSDGSDGSWSWLIPSWWGILGIIGWAYLTAGLAWLLTGGSTTALMGLLGGMIALYIGNRQGALEVLAILRPWLDVGQLFGSHPAIVTAGMLAGSILTRPLTGDSRPHRVFQVGLLGSGLLAAGFLLRPLHGFHKIGGTESYALATAGLCCLGFLAFHVAIDRFGLTAGTRFLQPVGANPLLAYLLPDILGKAMSLTGTWGLFWPFWQWGGWLGMANAAAMTLIVLGLTWLLTRKGVMLKL